MDRKKSLVYPVRMIIVAVAIATMIYATAMVIEFQSTDNSKGYVEGWVVDAYQIETKTYGNNTYLLWNITLSEKYQDIENGTSYKMLFNSSGYPAPPPEDVKIRLYYKMMNEYMLIYRVKSIE